VLAKRAPRSGHLSLDRGFDGMHHDLFDHGYYYRLDRCAAAIAAHVYDWAPEKLEAAADWGAQRGLAVSIPEFPSWWYPGRTTLLLWRSSQSFAEAVGVYREQHQGIDLREVPPAELAAIFGTAQPAISRALAEIYGK
jgi:hypothetical protein